EARKFIIEYFNDFKKIKEWQEGVKAQARTYGYVTNLNGRRRWLLKAVSMFRGEAAEAERAAINMPVQGLAADIIKMAMVKIGEELEKKDWCCFVQTKFSASKKQPIDKARLLLTIHDELLFEVKDDIIEEAIKFISPLMESVYELEVPVKVNVKIGDNLGNMNESQF
ncbi:MAG: DNA polymerase I, partial [Parcubacteria group bacterium Athens0714_26]